MFFRHLTVEEIIHALSSLPEYKCPACGHDRFMVLSWDGGKTPAIRDTVDVEFELLPNGMLQERPSKAQGLIFPTIQIVCKRCGHVSAHSYFALCERVELLRQKDGGQ